MNFSSSFNLFASLDSLPADRYGNSFFSSLSYPREIFCKNVVSTRKREARDAKEKISQKKRNKKKTLNIIHLSEEDLKKSANGEMLASFYYMGISHGVYTQRRERERERVKKNEM